MSLKENEVSSRTPYLVRAIRDWALDNNLTPQLLIDTTFNGVHVPLHAIENDRIVLNISPKAVNNIQIEQEFVSFSARFSGQEREVFIPIESILAIFDKESRQGVFFSPSPMIEEESRSDGKKEDKGRPQLKLVD